MNFNIQGQSKDAMPVKCDQSCLHLPFNHTLAVNHALVNITAKISYPRMFKHLKKKVRLCLFWFTITHGFTF